MKKDIDFDRILPWTYSSLSALRWRTTLGQLQPLYRSSPRTFCKVLAVLTVLKTPNCMYEIKTKAAVNTKKVLDFWPAPPPDQLILKLSGWLMSAFCFANRATHQFLHQGWRPRYHGLILLKPLPRIVRSQTTELFLIWNLKLMVKDYSVQKNQHLLTTIIMSISYCSVLWNIIWLSEVHQ